MEISGKLLRDGIISGANNISNNRNSVDELNVFPVPDGDTGTNMSMTIRNAVPELKAMGEDITVASVSSAAASAMLRGARGNSGVILSLLFRGLGKGLAGKTTATGKDFAEALGKGVEAAYKSVMKPTEGTILTVSREAAEAALKKAEETDDIIVVMEALIAEGEASLNRTPDLLPALKKAGVVDAGGMGFLMILKGIYSVLKGEGIIPDKEETAKKEVAVVSRNAAGSFETDIEFTYCTEYIVNKKEGCEDATKLRAYLESIGDSVVVVDDDGIIKVHVHTEHPGKALEKGICFGSLVNMKIENMKEQHKAQELKAENESKQKLAPVKPEKEFGFVAVASGEGVEALFTDLGVDSIVRGGQTSNPSTEDILEAVMATPAHNVFVLPNNKNIIMAAEQTVKLATDRNVIVLQTRSIPQGLTAMLSFDETISAAENSAAMTSALDSVGTALITFAVRDSEVDDKKIKQGDILGMENGKLAVVEKDIVKALYKTVKRLVSGSTSYITVIYGADVSEEDAAEAYETLKSRFSTDIEITLVNGGQPVYYYIVSVE